MQLDASVILQVGSLVANLVFVLFLAWFRAELKVLETQIKLLGQQLEKLEKKFEKYLS